MKQSSEESYLVMKVKEVEIAKEVKMAGDVSPVAMFASGLPSHHIDKGFFFT